MTRGFSSNLTRVDKVALIALILRLTYLVGASITGFPLPGEGLVRLFFVVALVLFLILSFPRLMRVFLWRVRHRLLVTWVFVGVVPIVLIGVLIAEIGFFLMGQVVSYMTTDEIVRESESVRSAADTLAWSIEHSGSSAAIPGLTGAFVRETSEKRHSQIGAIVRRGPNAVAIPQNEVFPDIPGWSRPGTFGLIKDKKKIRYYFGAHVARGAGKDATEVFIYETAPEDFFKQLLPGVAAVLPVEGNASGAGIDIRTNEKRSGGFTIRTNPDPDTDLHPLPPPPGRGWWDREVVWVVLMPTRDLGSGSDRDPSVAFISSRPSLIIGKLFSTLGTPAVVVVVVAIFTVIVLLVVEIVSALLGFKLTRSITRSIADLYQGTRRVQSGDFSHRIPVRKTRDQLSELGESFNAMTARIQDLIVEVKEKERLENELQIAREVQSQLFPKELPEVKTLQLWGGCQPARTVSGDYYDFISLAPGGAALAIGDISGKGISAALLMAHIQSALRSQLEDRGSAPVLSPSSILSILNNHLYRSSPPEKYATFFLGLYSDEASQLTYTNAGHLAPMVVRRGDVIRLPGEGFPVGLFPGVQYDQQVASLEPGDVLVAFTDGVTETPNRDDEEFGDRRLAELLVRYNHEPLDRIAAEITASVATWAGNVERHDDTTIILARRL